MEKLNSNQWSDYWKSGSKTTFDEIFENGYDGDIAQYWNDSFNFINSDSTVIDLGSGNGALISLLSEHCYSKSIVVDSFSIDYADISSLSNKTYKNLNNKVLSNTLIENIPLNDSSVDYAISQFGFEYSDSSKSIPELIRVLKPQGAVSFIMHSDSSILILQNRAIIEQIKMCLSFDIELLAKNLHPLMDKIIASIATEEETKLADAIRLEINESVNAIVLNGKKYKDQLFTNEYIKQYGEIFKHIKSAKVNCNELFDKMKVSSQEYLKRLSDMSFAALTKEDENQLLTEFTKAGFKNIIIEEFIYKGKKFGISIKAIK